MRKGFAPGFALCCNGPQVMVVCRCPLVLRTQVTKTRYLGHPPGMSNGPAVITPILVEEGRGVRTVSERDDGFTGVV